MATPKKVSLPAIDISDPKSVAKTFREEHITCVMPEYYRTVARVQIPINQDDTTCWFCNRYIHGVKLSIETLHGGSVGSFCSRICRDSFANIIRSHVALREEPKIAILPLVFFNKPDTVRDIIGSLQHKEGIYGTCFFDERSQLITVTLRCLI